MAASLRGGGLCPAARRGARRPGRTPAILVEGRRVVPASITQCLAAVRDASRTRPTPPIRVEGLHRWGGATPRGDSWEGTGGLRQLALARLTLSSARSAAAPAALARVLPAKSLTSGEQTQDDQACDV